MDLDGLSSPLFPVSSLPPSSAPNPTLTPSNGIRTTPNRPLPPPDALAFDDNEDSAANEDDAGRKRRKAKGQTVRDIPLVRDAVGESVAESFETFLKS
jgi:DNA replication licensing factor MCM6